MPDGTSIPPHLKASSRIASIQVCRGLAAIAVVLAHLHNLEAKYFNTGILSGFQFGVAGVDLFFVISGVVISAVTVSRFGSAPNAQRFLYQRFARIFPIYWVYSAIVLVAYLYNPLWINASGGHHTNILASFLLVPTGVPMLLLQGWTLSFEIYFYLMFFAFLLMCPERMLLWVLGMWAVVALAIHLGLHPAQPVVAMLCSPLICEFFLGCVLYALYRRFHLHPAAGVALVATSVLCFAGIVHGTTLAHHADATWIEDSSLNRLLLYGTTAALFLLGMMEMERTRLVAFSAPLVAVGDWSYSIYLSHTIVLKMVSHLFASVFPHWASSIVLVLSVSLPLVLLVGYLSFTFIERPLIALLYKPMPRRAPAIAHTQSAET